MKKEPTFTSTVFSHPDIVTEFWQQPNSNEDAWDKLDKAKKVIKLMEAAGHITKEQVEAAIRLIG
jgi:hypothetical protein